MLTFDDIVEWIRDVAARFGRIQEVAPDELTRLANKYRSDKGTQHFNKHNYSKFYFEIFKSYRECHLQLVEIGLLHISDIGWTTKRNYEGTAKATRAPSLQMWSSFFS